MKTRVMIVGLDGATWDILRPLAESGLMPNLRMFMNRGSWGTLQSIIPMSTPSAWVSFVTGKNPGKHGVFDFGIFDVGLGDQRIVRSTDIRAPTMWDIASKHGKKVASISVPLTYPLLPINGVMVAGLPAASFSASPSGLENELKDLIKDYEVVVSPESAPANTEAGQLSLVARVQSMTQAKIEVSRRIIQRECFDLFMLHVHGLDILQHALWHKFTLLTDQNLLESHRNDKVLQAILQYLVWLDNGILELFQVFGSKGSSGDSLLLIVSDHGFGHRLDKRIYVNYLLQEWGMLKGRRRSKIRKLGERAPLWNLYKRAELLLTLLRFKFLGSTGTGRSPGPVVSISSDFELDWDHTKAFALPGDLCGAVYINEKGRWETGTVSQGEESERLKYFLRAQFLNTKDPETGQPLFKQVFTRDEIYQGPQIELLPDLILIPADGYMVSGLLRSRLYTELTYEWTRTTHKMEGIFCAYGDAIVRSGRLEQDISILDCLPTILYALSLPVPEDVDGKLIKAIFTPTFRESHSLVYCDPQPPSTCVGQGVYLREEAVIRKRLEDLGYLG